MENFKIQKGSLTVFDRFLRIIALFILRSTQTIFKLYLLFTGATLLISSCERVSSLPSGYKPFQVDSVTRVINFLADSVFTRIDKLDLMVYEDKDLRTLISHSQYNSVPAELQIRTPKGSIILVAIANYPNKLGEASIQRYDFISKLSSSFMEDNPDAPIMSVWGRTEVENIKLELQPLMSRVKLRSITNLLEDYELLEEPRIRLVDINANATILQSDPFSPKETIEYGVWRSLPYDIGLYTQYPEINLYCYPSSDPLAAYSTRLEFECTIRAKKCSFLLRLPPLKRNSLTCVDLSIEDEDNFSYQYE